MLTCPCALLSLILLAAAPGPPDVAAVYRPDAPFPEFMPLWREGWSWRDETGEPVRYARPDMPLGGYVFASFRNTGRGTLSVDDVRFEGVSLAQAVAFDARPKVPGLDVSIASLKFSTLPAEQIARLEAAGEPVWWKIEPTAIPPGRLGELTIRLRRDPASETVRLSIPAGEGRTHETALHVRQPQPRFFSISFSPGLDHVCAYLRHPSGKGIAPARVFVDDRDVTSRSTIVADEPVDTVAAVVSMEQPFQEGSYHLFTAEYADGSLAQACLGAWSPGMVYGMWGCTQGSSPEETGRQYVADLAAHNVNVFMIHCGGPANEYLNTPEGLKLMESHGIRHMLTWTAPDRRPIFYFLTDEPDAADFLSTMLEPHRRIGSRAQYLVERCKLFRRHDPATRPILLNVDNTFKPENWYTYAQLADIPCADPYYQEAVQSVWACDPTNLGAYLKPTYVYAVGSIYQSAGAPNPMHLILHTCRFDFKPEESPYRAPTPQEKRIEVYDALAAGAKQISYWWYTPDTRYYGIGGDAPEMKALWNEVGLLGAEVGTVGDLIQQSCPAGLTVEAPRLIRVRSLLAGAETAILLVVNDNMASDRLGTVIRPVEKARMTVRPPAWLRPAAAFEITCEGIRDVAWRVADGRVLLDLGTVEVTRLLVLTQDAGLRARLQQLHEDCFAGKVKRLVEEKARLGHK